MSQTTIIINIRELRFECALYNTAAARNLVKVLPQELRLHRWGDEYFGELANLIRHDGDAQRDVYEVGEVALWPDGNALCIFFGPTPASRNREPRMSSNGVPLGKMIAGDLSELKQLMDVISNVSVSLKAQQA